uniref:protein FAM240B n=1 Tax=Semicossyphus pulcher TaxID=241346 RepID=UPI0037E93DA5
MNLALIHDRLHIKTFWEKRIDSECQHVESEELRRNKSALTKLRGEWLVRLENRTKHLKSLNDSYVRKAKAEKSADQTVQTNEDAASS